MTLQTLALSLFTTVMAVAAFEDFRRLTIPNLLPLLLCAAWPFYVAAAPVPGSTLGAALGAAGCALAVFLGGAVLFARGWLGGGDVKLLAAAILWAGPAGTPQLLVATGVLGGGMTLFFLVPPGAPPAASPPLILRQMPLGPPIRSPAPPPPCCLRPADTRADASRSPDRLRRSRALWHRDRRRRPLRHPAPPFWLNRHARSYPDPRPARRHSRRRYCFPGPRLARLAALGRH